MITSGQSDLAANLRMNSQQSGIRAALDSASQSIVSGKKVNLVEASAGDLSHLFSIEHSLVKLNEESSAIDLAMGKAGLAQKSLTRIHERLMDSGPQLLAAVERKDFQSMTIIGRDARSGLESVVSAMNSRFGRHNIFSGAAVDVNALAPAQDLINDISTIVASSADAASALALIETYFFSPGGGFETNIYRGSNQDGPPLKGADGLTVEYLHRADSREIRDSLRALALAAVAADAPNFSGTNDQAILLREAAVSSMNANDSIIALQEGLGLSENRLANEQSRNRSHTDAFQLEHSRILSADPYETATLFQSLEAQLQSVFTLTSRLSNLTLNNFLR